jgi:hypothetical protein
MAAASSPRTEWTLHVRSLGIECDQARDSVGNPRPGVRRSTRELFGRFDTVAGVTPGRDPGGNLEREIQPSEVDQPGQTILTG